MKRAGLSAFILVFVFSPLLIVGFQNCSNARLSKTEPPSKSQFPKLRPVMAVRGGACLSCHAKIHSDFITDFGYGNKFFFGDSRFKYDGKEPQKHHFNIYGNWAGGYSTISLFQDIVVPQVYNNDPAFLADYSKPQLGNSSSDPIQGVQVKDIMNSKFIFPDINNGSAYRFLEQPAVGKEQDMKTAGLRGKVVARKKVWIAAPTDEQLDYIKRISSAKPALSQQNIDFVFSTPDSRIQGLFVEVNPAKQFEYYVSNRNRRIYCVGDVFIDSPLFLNEVEVETDDGGCRLYVKGSVYIQGDVKYVTLSKTPNLQISSTKAIMMGVKSIKHRFSLTEFGLRGMETQGEERIFDAKIFSERDRIQGLEDDAGPFWVKKEVSVLPDGKTPNPNSQRKILAFGYGNDDPSTEWRAEPGVDISRISNADCPFVETEAIKANKTCFTEWAENSGNKRKFKNYKGLVLNAPEIHSRYMGTFKGVIIAEQALFAVGNLDFYYDEAFDDVPILPLLNKAILDISEN